MEDLVPRLRQSPSECCLDELREVLTLELPHLFKQLVLLGTIEDARHSKFNPLECLSKLRSLLKFSEKAEALLVRAMDLRRA